ncbi:ATP-dependent RNA helicase HrpA [Leifsonia bigeumensis]|uniref:ATP-dependent RNA helicase HrpA n=1 Tax=Leifsonella bigeumensis TaxID=433643 RepID=A0ABP7FFW9_9MICO
MNASPRIRTVPVSTVPITYPPDLPVSQRRDDIAAAIRDHQVVIVAGATGSGKTTQLPKICLELGRESIGHTQPRRIAARTIAERIAEELGTELGGLVGYQVRFTDKVGKDTRIKLMTDGILLNEIHRDRMLKKYDTIIIDEAHERSLTVDFLLGYLKQLLPKRPDLKVIITSATIDPESFARHFADAAGTPAPIVEVSGRSYPVEIRYRPLSPDPPSDDPADDPDATPDETRESRRLSSAEGAYRNHPGKVSIRPRAGYASKTSGQRSTNESPEGTDLFDGINAALDELSRENDGDVLVFLSGENEIRDAEEAIKGRISAGSIREGTEVLPLYGRLSAADQHRVFGSRPAGIRRRIVLATNVAETSLTVPGIRYVIDAGTARISRYSVRSKIQRLPIEAISQASANQRSGRSGRTSDGIAIRLYSEEDYLARPEFTEPEILRTNLAAVILQMISLGLGDIAEFPFLQPPDSRGIKDGLDLLRELGAVSTSSTGEKGGSTGEKGGSTDSLGSGLSRPPRITKIGRQLAGLPIDPRLGRMVIESGKYAVTREVMAIVAALSIQDPRERPLEKRPQADQSHARFTDKTSDFVTLLNLWNYTKRKEKELSSSAFRRLCKAEYLNYLRIREWGDVYRQLTRLAKQLGLTVGRSGTGAADDGPTGADAVGIHRALLAGLLSQIGIRDEQKGDAKKQQRGEYLGARQVRFAIFPGSALAKKQPAEVMSAELVETSRLFARTNAAIDLSWAEPIAGDLAKHSYSEPHWEKKQGSAVVYERVTLYGVPIVARRRVQLGRIDPELARELFIRSALVDGEWDFGGLDKRLTAFDRANRTLRRELAEVEERTRRRDILFDDEAVFGFYDRMLPAEVTDQRAFESWWKKARAENPDLLTMTRADLLDEDVPVPEKRAARHEGRRPDLDARYPDVWHQGDQRLKLSYRFEPGAEDDGVTVHVPIALLPRLAPAGFDWQVPGLREELVVALIKSLPKAIRRNVVPAADWARRLLQDAPIEGSDEVGLREFLAAQIQRATYTPVAVDDFDLERIPPHLMVTFAVIDEHGRKAAASKDLGSLQHKLRSRTRESVAKAVVSTPNAIERDGLTSWDFDELPRILDTRQAGNTIRAYPALVDDGPSVAIRLMATPADQAREHRRGVLRMLQLAVPSPTGYVQEHLTAPEKLALARSPYPSTSALFADCMLACADAVLGERDIRSRADFEGVRDEFSASVLDSLFAAVSLVSSVLAAARNAEKAITAASSIALIAPLADAREQLDALVFPGFVSRTGLAQLRRLPVYLTGITHRVGKLAENLGRDRVWMSEVQSATERYRAAGGELPPHPDAAAALTHARWLLEELRLSLFAQHLGTAEPVSLQRITKLLANG